MKNLSYFILCAFFLIASVRSSLAEPGIKDLLLLAKNGVPSEVLTSEWRSAGFSLSQTYIVDKVPVTALDYAIHGIVHNSDQIFENKLELVRFLIVEAEVPWSPKAVKFLNKYVRESQGSLLSSIFRTSNLKFVISVLKNLEIEQRQLAALWIARNREEFLSFFSDEQDRLIISGFTLVGSFRWKGIRTTFQDFMRGLVDVEHLISSPSSTLCCNQLVFMMSYLSGAVAREDIERLAFCPIETEEPYFSFHQALKESTLAEFRISDHRAMYFSVNACIYRNLGRDSKSPRFVRGLSDIKSYLSDQESRVALIFFSMRGFPDIQHVAITYLDPFSSEVRFFHINDDAPSVVEELADFYKVKSTYQLCDIAKLSFGKKKDQ